MTAFATKRTLDGDTLKDRSGSTVPVRVLQPQMSNYGRKAAVRFELL
jgi:hypothetical protein